MAGASVLAIVTGRVFAIVELYVIGAALAVAVALAVVVVGVHRPALSVHRWAHPPILTVGDAGRVDLFVQNESSWRSPRARLTDPVGADNAAQVEVAPLLGGEFVQAGYRVPATRRGVLVVGPTVLERRDVLGLALDRRTVAAAIDVPVSPRTIELPMPSLGSGVLGRHLLALSQRAGPGEFHSLRDYVDGDELRSIHWKASARSDGLKVRQHEAQGVRRCIIVLDRDRDAYPAADETGLVSSFERAVSAAGSLVLGADRTGLMTRFVSGGGIDLRGPEISPHTLSLLAEIDVGPRLDEYDRDPGEGLGLIVVVTSSPDTDAWRRTSRTVDPLLTRVGVFADRPDQSRMTVDATSIASLRADWLRLAGSQGLTRNVAGEWSA